MMFSVVLAALLLTAGVGLDYTNMVRLKSDLQAQVDAAVLAAATADVTLDGNNGRNANQENKIREEAALSVLEANGFDPKTFNPKLDFSSSTVVLNAETMYRPFFGNLMGQEEVMISAMAESGLPGRIAVDVALVLDNTEAISVNGKLDALIEGATSLVEAIESSSSDSRVGIVPFAKYVRIDTGLREEPWFEAPEEFDTIRSEEQAIHTGGSCIMETQIRTIDGVEQEREMEVCTGQTTTYGTVEETIESRWIGCVGTRFPPFNEQDGAYSHKIPGLLNIDPAENTGLNRDLRSWCPAKIVPLTDDYDKVKQRLGWLWPTSHTYIPSGLIWGQRILSPGEPFDSAIDATGERKKKVMILMTDGHNTSEIKMDSNAIQYKTAPPYVAYLEPHEVAVNANVVTARLCESIKAEGTEIYTIAFQVDDPATQSLLVNCASDPEKALSADNNEALISQFESISSSIEEDVRLIR